MITEEHLKHWISEISWALTGIEKEIAESKLKGQLGLTVEVSPGKKEFVSFEYLREKASTIRGTLRCIEDDIKND